MDDLKQCPFCPSGGDPQLQFNKYPYDDEAQSEGQDVVYVECGECGARSTEIFVSNDDIDIRIEAAKAVWNRRA